MIGVLCFIIGAIIGFLVCVWRVVVIDYDAVKAAYEAGRERGLDERRTVVVKSQLQTYGSWLGRECWAKVGKDTAYRRYKVTAVSWKGGICVRDWDCCGGYGSRWINKREVKDRVCWSKYEIPEGEVIA